MKPQKNIKGRKLEVFKDLVKCIEEAGRELKDIDSYELSLLASNIVTLEENEVNANGVWFHTFPNGTSQVNPFFTIKEKTEKTIMSLGAKFGLSLKDRDALGVETKVEDKPKKLDDFFLKKAQ